MFLIITKCLYKLNINNSFLLFLNKFQGSSFSIKVLPYFKKVKIFITTLRTSKLPKCCLCKEINLLISYLKADHEEQNLD